MSHKKIEITDEMVERALGEFTNKAVDFTKQNAWMRKILDAAINPPQEPEIVVTEEMVAAGEKAYDEQPWGSSNCRGRLRVAYRAMRKLEPKPCYKNVCGDYSHRRRSDQDQGHTSHRRKGD